MGALSIIHRLARASVLDRIRRHSFLVMLGVTVYLGHQVAVGRVALRLDSWRGEFNSAWTGSLMALVGSFFLGAFGFYLVRGSVAHDEGTGVGELLASTPITRARYVWARALANLALLAAMMFVLGLAAIGAQFFAGEDTRILLPEFLAPFLLLTLPVLAVVAATAVLFECVGPLRGGLGNVAYFLCCIAVFPLADGIRSVNPAIEPLGLGILQPSMQAAAEIAFREQGGGAPGDVAPSGLGIDFEPATRVFHWSGVAWTPAVILTRLGYFGFAALLVGLASLFFGRFEGNGRGLVRPTIRAPDAHPVGPALVQAVFARGAWTPVSRLSSSRFAGLLSAEIRLLIRGRRRTWYWVAAGLNVAGLVAGPGATRAVFLPLALIWPLFVWSGMGCREAQCNVHQLTFSSPSPLWRQLPAQWLAGVIVACAAGLGACLRLLIAGETSGLLAALVAILFVPSLALAAGVWSGSGRLFEVAFMVAWYLGPLNRAPGFDFTGAGANSHPMTVLLLSAALLLLAFIGRARRLRHAA